MVRWSWWFVAACIAVPGPVAAARAAVPCDPLREARTLGAAWYAHGVADEARRALAEAATLAPDQAADQHNAGLAAHAAGDLVGARTFLEGALALDPGRPATWFALGLVAKREGDLAGAEEALRRCRDAGGADPGLAYELASVAARQGDAQAAADLARLFAAARGERVPDLLPVGSPPAGDGGAGALPAFVPSPLPAPDEIRWADPADLDGDGDRDLLLGDGQTLRDLRRSGGGWVDVTASRGLAGLLGVTMARAIDLDGDGAVDLVRAGGGGIAVHSGLEGGWEPPRPVCRETVTRFLVLDVDLDGDPDLLAAAAGGPRLFRNRSGRSFDDVTAGSGLEAVGPIAAMAAGDLDGDGDDDAVLATRDGRVLVAANARHGRLEIAVVEADGTSGAFDLALADLDGDGDVDIATAGSRGVGIVVNAGGLAWSSDAAEPVLAGPVRWPTPGGSSLWTADLDGDGRPDLLVAREAGGEVAMNRGGLAFESTAGSLVPFANAGAWPIAVGLVDDDAIPDAVGSDAAVAFGRGVTGTDGGPELPPPAAAAPPGAAGAPGPRLTVESADGRTLAAALLAGARLGLPPVPGESPRPPTGEIVRVAPDRLRAGDDGTLVVRVTANARGVAYLDRVRLLAVDHPAEVEVQPEAVRLASPATPPGVRVLDAARIPVRALDDRDRDVTDRLLAADGLAVDDLPRTRWAGVTERHTLEIDFGDVPPEAPLVLFLAGTLRPTTASSRVAVSQDPGHAIEAPRVRVPDGLGGWVELPLEVGLPPGGETSVAVDLTGAFPAGRARLRVASTLDIAWDRARLAVGAAAVVPRITPLDPLAVELVARDAVRASPASPDPIPGLYTRAGDVTSLLAEADDCTVVLGAGDTCLVRWTADALPPLAPGQARTLLLVFDGWTKDDDPNTAASDAVEPLPFHGMSAYPPPPGEPFPADETHRAWRIEWNTRSPGAPSSALPLATDGAVPATEATETAWNGPAPAGDGS